MYMQVHVLTNLLQNTFIKNQENQETGCIYINIADVIGAGSYQYTF